MFELDRGAVCETLAMFNFIRGEARSNEQRDELPRARTWRRTRCAKKLQSSSSATWNCSRFASLLTRALSATCGASLCMYDRETCESHRFGEEGKADSASVFSCSLSSTNCRESVDATAVSEMATTASCVECTFEHTAGEFSQGNLPQAGVTK